jgi:two-component system cell cycle sensor histidine kinase/response regulator CckA
LAAESAEAALSVLDTAMEPPVVVVTDMMMPGMDGASLVRELRNRPGLGALPAVLVSGYADETLRRELDSAATLFLPKPYSLRDLAARVAEIAGLRETVL